MLLRISEMSSPMESEEQKFASQDEAFAYYRKLASEYKKRLDEVQQELEEFQDGSRELEAELEVQLEQSESKIKDLKAQNSQLQLENGRLQAKLYECQTESSRTIGDLQDDLIQEKLVREDLQNYVRQLEQKNDDLERAMRASVSSLEDFEVKFNQAIERNAFLENELDEKENMAALIQRLKDETRDLKQELVINETPRNNDFNQSPTKIPEKIIGSNKIDVGNASPRYRFKKSLTHANGVLNSPSSVPYSALNIVGDLLKKVGVLESKLQSCRDCIKDSSDHMVESHPTSKLTSPNHVRHMNGSTLSTPKDYIPLTA